MPVSIYADRHAIFFSRNAGKLSLEDQLGGKVVNDTQFGRAMSELGISLFPARSPQAKGRVERLWETLQSRLPVEFALANITTIDQANAFLVSYIALFNQHFSVEPVKLESAFRAVPQNLDLDAILCVKMNRILDADEFFRSTTVTFCCFPILRWRYRRKRRSMCESIPALEFAPSTKKRCFRCCRTSSPKKSQLGKKGHTLTKKLSFEDNDRDILHVLEDIFLKNYA